MEWYLNGNLIQHGSPYYIGGGETINDQGPCEELQYRVAILIRNRITGTYHYRVYNDITTEGFSSKELIVTSQLY